MTTVLGNIFVASILVSLGTVVLLAIAVGYDSSIERHQAARTVPEPIIPTVPIDPNEPAF